MERELLGACLKDRKTWEEICKLGKEDGASFSDVAKVIWKAIDGYYKKDRSAMHVNINVLLTKLEATTNDKSFETIKDVCKSLPAVSISNIKEAYITQKRQALGLQLAAALLGKDTKKTSSLVSEYKELLQGNLPVTGELDLYPSDDTRALFDSLDKDRLLRLRPLALSDRLDGGVCKGDHVLISGRVENGKTLFAVNLSCGLAYDGYKGLYVGNEDGPRRMRPRFLSRFSGMTKNEIYSDRMAALDAANARGYANLTFAGQAPSSPLSPVAEELERGEYDFVVVDQIRNIASEDDNKAGKLEDAAVGMRDLCKKYDVLGISVTQSLNGFAQINKLVCDMGDVADSKHGLPGQADLIIMLGTNEEFRQKNQIMLSVVKNKISGWHGSFAVSVNPLLSKVEEALI